MANKTSLNGFFKENVEELKNTFYPASKRMKDENGKPIKWEIRFIPNPIMSKIKEDRANGTISQIEAGLRMAVAAIVYPDLNNAALQDSYGVKNPKDLLSAMLSSAELDKLEEVVVEANGYTEDFNEKVEKAKN